MNRRGFLKGLASALAAPAVVCSGVLMPLRGLVMYPPPDVTAAAIIDRLLREDALKFQDLKAIVDVMRERHIPPMPDGSYLMVVPKGGILGSRRVLEHQGNRVRFAEQGADGRVSVRREVEVRRRPGNGACRFDGS